MRRFIPAVAVLWFAHAMAAAPTNAVFEMNAEGEVQIAPDGHVSDYRLKSTLAPVIAKLVDTAVRGWQFEPVLVDGKPVVAKTAMRLSLRAEPADAGNYRIRVTNVIFGEPHVAAHVKLPKYPESAIAAHVGAKVLMYVKLDESGNVVEVEPYQTSLDVRANSEVQAESFRKLFESASVRAARFWHYDLTETINGKKVGTIAMVPVVYSLHGFGVHSAGDGEWKGYVPGPLRETTLGREAKVTSSDQFADLAEGQAQPLDSHFKLREDVVGKIL